ncbi:hypothetical protein HNO89_001096 [Sporosarcina luteola]|nr:hypothetical protein [Sporosarcina luteola]
MKFNNLDNIKLGQILLMVPAFAISHNHTTIKQAISEMDSSLDNTLEVEYVNDLFSLSTHEIADKWFDGFDENNGMVGIFYEDK